MVEQFEAGCASPVGARYCAACACSNKNDGGNR
jgi:hypothetical protein